MKKAEVSNNTLVALLLVAIAVSVIGTYMSVSRVGKMAPIYLAGYAPANDAGSALVNLTVDQILDINFTTAAVDWGIGSVDPGEINCTISTLTGNTANCNGFTDKSGAPLLIENIGNVNVTMNISFDKNATLFIGGTSPGYEFNMTCNEANSCRNATGSSLCTTAGQGYAGSGLPQDTTDASNESVSGVTLPGSWIFVNATTETDYIICPNFDYAEASDQISIDLTAIIPTDSYTGNLTSTVTATAYVVEAHQ